MTYEYALITVNHFPAGLDCLPCTRTSPGNAQAINHNEASLAGALNLNFSSTLFYDASMHRGDGLGQAQGVYVAA
jgi:hypothetical protein